jgi:hypothetical protein
MDTRYYLCPSPLINILKLQPTIRQWVFGRWLAPVGGVLMSEISVLI